MKNIMKDSYKERAKAFINEVDGVASPSHIDEFVTTCAIIEKGARYSEIELWRASLENSKIQWIHFTEDETKRKWGIELVDQLIKLVKDRKKTIQDL